MGGHGMGHTWFERHKCADPRIHDLVADFELTRAPDDLDRDAGVNLVYRQFCPAT